jgi:thymidylate synthase
VKQYLSLVREVLENGEEKNDRTGTGTLSVFGMQRKYDLREGFPMVTTKKVTFKFILRELLWFLKGATNINDGLKQYTSIWNPWADEDGNLGPIYGYQWRKWEKFEHDEETGVYKKTHVDQIRQVIDQIKNQPDSNGRRLIVSAWNVADVPRMALPPCHTFFQFNVVNGRLDMQLYQRSADIALGVPYNIASYATLLQMVAMECDLEAGVFVHTMGDAHIYSNHVEGMKQQLEETPRPLPKLLIEKKPFWDLEYEDFKLEGYEHGPVIKFPIAV